MKNFFYVEMGRTSRIGHLLYVVVGSSSKDYRRYSARRFFFRLLGKAQTSVNSRDRQDVWSGQTFSRRLYIQNALFFIHFCQMQCSYNTPALPLYILFYMSSREGALINSVGARYLCCCCCIVSFAAYEGACRRAIPHVKRRVRI